MKLIIPKKIEQRLDYYVETCSQEISGLGKVEYDEVTNTFVLVDIVLLDQKVTSATTDLDPAAIAKFQYDMTKKGESLKGWCVWWHSHVHMQSFFSSTDINTINKSNDFPFLVSVVLNKKGEYQARLDVYKPIRIEKKLAIEFESYERDKKLFEEIEKEVAEKVRKAAPWVYRGKEHGHNPHTTYGYDYRSPHAKKMGYERDTSYDHYHDNEPLLLDDGKNQKTNIEIIKENIEIIEENIAFTRELMCSEKNKTSETYLQLAEELTEYQEDLLEANKQYDTWNQ